MTKNYFAESALLPSGWARDVLFEVGQDGLIAKATPGAAAGDAERLRGPAIPGMPNLHSHAFQRAMAGLTEKGGPQGDSFWSWRKLMYGFLENLTPDDVEVIAAQLYIEMLRAGYTAVAEFHYLHHDPQGRPYANLAETGERIAAAARGTGIALSLLPVFYAHGNFGGIAPTVGQRRFINSLDGFGRILESLAKTVGGDALQRIGVAPHSLRAVTPEELKAVVAAMERIDAKAPIHIHAAEQQKEVDDCLSWGGTRPVAWLLDNVQLDARWCVVHATHMDANETKSLARTGAGCAPPPRAISATASSTPRPTCAPAAGSASAATAMRRSIPFWNCACSNTASGSSWNGATCWPSPSAIRSAAICTAPPVPAARRRWDRTSASWPRASAPTGWCSTAMMPRWPSRAKTACSTRRFSARCARRCGT